MFCHMCGAKLKDNAKFCSKCGTKIEDDDFVLEEDENENFSSVLPSKLKELRFEIQRLEDKKQAAERKNDNLGMAIVAVKIEKLQDDIARLENMMSLSPVEQCLEILRLEKEHTEEELEGLYSSEQRTEKSRKEYEDNGNSRMAKVEEGELNEIRSEIKNLESIIKRICSEIKGIEENSEFPLSFKNQERQIGKPYLNKECIDEKGDPHANLSQQETSIRAGYSEEGTGERQSEDTDEFNVRIGDCQITYPANVKTYVSVMMMLEESTKESKQTFDSYYREAGAVTSSLYDKGMKCLDIVIESILRFMGTLGVYEIQKEQLLTADDYGQSALEIWQNYCGGVFQKIDLITSEAQNERDAREYRKETRFRVVGGGFGLKGAAKGMLEAAAINAVTGAAHGVFNMFGNASTDNWERKSKQELYEDPRTINTLQYGLALAGELLKKEALYMVGVRPFPINAAERANVILDNIKNNRVDREHLQDAFMKVFRLNPFSQEAYIHYLMTFGDADGSLQEYAENFNLGNIVSYMKNVAFREAIKIEFHLDRESDDYDIIAGLTGIVSGNILSAIDGETEVISLYIDKDVETIERDLKIIKKWQDRYASEIGRSILEDMNKVLQRVRDGSQNQRIIATENEDYVIGEYSHALQKNIQSLNFSSTLREISRGAFNKCSFGNEGAPPLSIRMPDTLKTIGEEAFAECENLGEVILNEGLEYIGNRAFWGCEGLKYLRIPDSVTYLGDNIGGATGPKLDLDADSPAAAMIRERAKDGRNPWGYTGVLSFNWDSEDIQIPKEYTAIEQGLFQGTRAKKLILHSGIREISKGCFTDSQLEKIEFAEGLQRIGVEAFASSYNLREVIIPSTVKEIAESAFAFCSHLERIELPEGLEKLGDNALNTLRWERNFVEECALKAVLFPESLIEIGKNVVAKDYTTIVCAGGSFAWFYAQEYGYKFEEVFSNARIHFNQYLAKYNDILGAEPNAHIVRVSELLYEGNPVSNVFFFVQSQRLQANSFDPNDQWALMALNKIQYAITSYAASATDEEIPLFVYEPPAVETESAYRIFITNQFVYIEQTGKNTIKIKNDIVCGHGIQYYSNGIAQVENKLGIQIKYHDYAHGNDVQKVFVVVEGPAIQIAITIINLTLKIFYKTEAQHSPSGWITVGSFRATYR